jgi:DNA-binding GntR family transcriptional regulator
MDADSLPGQMPPTPAPSVPYDLIRDDIVAGNLLPEAKLKIHELRQRYRTGTSPLREALSKLAADGFVTQSENRGFRVAPADLAIYEELVQLKCWIEGTALRESIANGSSQWEYGIVIAGYDLEKGILSLEKDRTVTDPKFDLLHKRFHMALISGCNNREVEKLCSRLYDHTARYRSLYRPKVIRDQRGDEHKEVGAAALARDADRAVSLLTAHYRLTAELLRSDFEHGRGAWPQPSSGHDAIPYHI